MGPTWGPPGTCRPQMGPMLAPWTLLSGCVYLPGSAGLYQYASMDTRAVSGEVAFLVINFGHADFLNFALGCGGTVSQLLGCSYNDDRAQTVHIPWQNEHVSDNFTGRFISMSHLIWDGNPFVKQARTRVTSGAYFTYTIYLRVKHQ